MRLLLDLNVVLDVLLERKPHAQSSVALWRHVERRRAVALVPAHGFTTVFYIAQRHRDRAFATRVVEILLGVFGVAPVNEAVLRRALQLGWPDFEDAVVCAAAETARCDALVTRDPRGFAGATLSVLDPAGAVALIATR